jgi:hypothetical protein
MPKVTFEVESVGQDEDDVGPSRGRPARTRGGLHGHEGQDQGEEDDTASHTHVTKPLDDSEMPFSTDQYAGNGARAGQPGRQGHSSAVSPFRLYKSGELFPTNLLIPQRRAL